MLNIPSPMSLNYEIYPRKDHKGWIWFARNCVTGSFGMVIRIRLKARRAMRISMPARRQHRSPFSTKPAKVIESRQHEPDHQPAANPGSVESKITFPICRVRGEGVGLRAPIPVCVKSIFTREILLANGGHATRKFWPNRQGGRPPSVQVCLLF